MILDKLNLTRPEKAVMISAMCLVNIGGQPTMSNIGNYLIVDAKSVLEYPGVKDLCFLACEKKDVLSLLKKVGANNDS